MRLAVFAVLALAGAPLAHAQTAPKLESEDDKTVYAIGYSIAGSLTSLALSKAEIELLLAGIRDGAAGTESQVAMETYGPKIRALQGARAANAAAAEKVEASKWLYSAAKKQGAETLASGVIIQQTAAGTGDAPKASSRVKVHYVGTLRNGSEFDSSRSRGEPAEFPLNGVIPCWTEALQKMKVGGSATLWCPADKAYGDNGTGAIPPGAALKFEVELLEILP